jgi:SRSO17 transposase
MKADSIYGNSPEFISAVEDMPHVTYLVSMPADTLCWVRNPVLLQKQYRYKGELRSEQVLKTPDQKPIPFETIAKNTNNYFWYRRKVSEGTKGPIEYEFTKKRVVLSKNGLPEKEVWLLIRRTLGNEPTYSYFVCNASVSCRLNLLVWLSGTRWAIERCFEEAKTEIGMDHYEVRKFPGWVHHMMTCMLAHFFLWRIKLRSGKKAPAITLSQLRILIRVVLPVRSFDCDGLISLVAWIQEKNHRAYLSHRKKKPRLNIS